MKQSLEDLREEIASIDGAMLRLWQRRLYAAAKIGALKREAGAGIFDPEREKQLWAGWQQQVDAEEANLAAWLFLANTTTAKLRQSQVCGLDRPNLYLIGMPAAGKSTVGRELAALSGRGFCDMDRVLSDIYDCSIARMFETEGEALFRARETALLSALASQPAGLVVATGGGIVLSALNLSLMQASGAIIHIMRGEPQDEDLADHSRPLCQDREQWQALWRQREPLYRAAAQVNLVNREAGQCAAQLAALLTDGGQGRRG